MHADAATFCAYHRQAKRRLIKEGSVNAAAWRVLREQEALVVATIALCMAARGLGARCVASACRYLGHEPPASAPSSPSAPLSG